VTHEERRLRTLLIAHAIWSGVLALGYLVGADVTTFGFMPNSFAKDVLFVSLSAIAAADVRRFGWLALVIAAGYVALVIGMVVTLAVGGSPRFEELGVSLPATVALAGWMAIDLLLVALFVWWWLAAERAGRGLRYLNPIAFHTLKACAEVLVEGRDEALTPEQVAYNVDGYLANLKASGKANVHVALTAIGLLPLATLRPPLAALAPATRRRYLERRFVDEVSERRVFKPLRPFVQGMIRTASQMAYLGYYGDERSWKSIGYTPYQHRKPAGRPPEPDDRPAPPLRSLTAPPRHGHPRYDTLVIGSGAAGSILAYRFAQTGRRVLVLERGPHADPGQFSDDEVGQYLRLYNEGALQLATDFNLQVLQGMCVGGGTTVNNALCLDPPGAVLEAWEERGIDRGGLEAGIEAVRRWLDVREIDPETTTEAAARFKSAAEALRLPGRLEVMSANISARCRGCGYCNIGCAYGAKLSTLDSVLPWAQVDPEHPLQVLPDFEVEQVAAEGGRALGVHGRHRDGERLFIGADEVVVAAGAIGSSWLLQRSGLGGAAVGRGLHFNINSPLTADFPDTVDSFAGIQMSHAYVPHGGVPGYLVETWFNPPATQSLAMPGWFGQHFENMRRYRHMACAGVLAGTTRPGAVTAGRNGPQIQYTPSEDDRSRVVEGLKVAGRIFLEAGATRVMPATFKWHAFESREQLDRLGEHVRQDGDLMLTSAHPQGGNAIGERGQGVVDPGFRVHGFDNLFLCDASVFPTSVHVNPQLTVMGMAYYAAERILGHQEPPLAAPDREP
jgi:choline dehydrogenase-like flavoprotein